MPLILFSIALVLIFIAYKRYYDSLDRKKSQDPDNTQRMDIQRDESIQISEDRNLTPELLEEKGLSLDLLDKPLDEIVEILLARNKNQDDPAIFLFEKAFKCIEITDFDSAFKYFEEGLLLSIGLDIEPSRDELINFELTDDEDIEDPNITLFFEDPRYIELVNKYFPEEK